MNDRKRFYLEVMFICGYFIIPLIDQIYITPGMKESGTLMEIQCKNDPKNCWIQVKDKKT